MLTIRVFGGDCPNCNQLEKMCFNVLAYNSMDADVQKITDIKKIAEYGIMHTPALVINNKVYCSGKLPTEKDLFRWFRLNLIESCNLQ
ncbi:MAG: thioredoxin family protein [Ignavibacteriae bacterium]|nr:MAG: thioredoxin family protein [Ignavibacteriota bacterium]